MAQYYDMMSSYLKLYFFIICGMHGHDLLIHACNFQKLICI